MKSVSMLSLAIVLMSSMICSGQVNLALQDVSATESPLQVSGSMSFEDDASKTIRYSYQIKGSVMNVSGRGVVLMVIHFESTGLNAPALDYTYQDDRFFSPNILPPSKAQSFRSSVLRFGAYTVNGRPVTMSGGDASSAPAASAQVMFVQFVDGATWGDVDVGREPVILRNQTLRELGRLERILGREGEQALKNEFSKSENTFPCIGSVMDDCKGKGASCFADSLRSLIESAKQHQADMKAKSTALSNAIR